MKITRMLGFVAIYLKPKAACSANMTREAMISRCLKVHPGQQSLWTSFKHLLYSQYWRTCDRWLALAIQDIAHVQTNASNKKHGQQSW
jgi:hypothetical protein